MRRAADRSPFPTLAGRSLVDAADAAALPRSVDDERNRGRSLP